MAELPEVGLAAALEALRDELESAWHASRGRSIRFRASKVTLTMEAVAGSAPPWRSRVAKV